MPPNDGIEALAPVSPLDTFNRLSAAVLDRGGDVGQLAKLLELHEQYTRDRAAEAYARALAGFQAECPAILKTKQAGRFKFAPFELIMQTIDPILQRWGIVVTFSFPTCPTPGMMSVACKLRVGTHAEDHPFSFPTPDPKALAEFTNGAINGPQAIGQIISYFKRYALCAALNIVIAGEDTDAAGRLETITEAEVAQLRAMIADPAKAVNEAAFMAYVKQACGAESLETITRKAFPGIHDALKRKGSKPAPAPQNGGK